MDFVHHHHAEAGLFVLGFEGLEGSGFGVFGAQDLASCVKKILTSLPPGVTICGRGFELDAYRNAETSWAWSSVSQTLEKDNRNQEKLRK